MSEEAVEQWKAIPGYPGYEVSDQGRVRSYWKRRGGWSTGFVSSIEDTPRILKMQKKSAGYWMVELRRGEGGKRQVFTVIRLVLMAFVRLPEPGEMALHKDTPDKSDSRLCNLQWGWRSENNGADIVRHKGKHPCSSFTPDDVREIRRRLATGEVHREIAADYDVDPSTITAISRRKNHAYIK